MEQKENSRRGGGVMRQIDSKKERGVWRERGEVGLVEGEGESKRKGE